ncbi:hypothetical protein [Kitasatospora sp. NPDC059327]|uniref:hypothetical protein n=1 Tax=Kitasatospora sp. NPDC059327 TaxID=3346803 RepID=UPI00369E4DA0
MRTYRISVKSFPPAPGSPAPAGQDPAAAEMPKSQTPADDARQWAGDPYDEGDEPQPDDPSITARFSDPAGEEAWLERAPDGTLTGWLRDPSGQVYRYSDPDAWAVDVDDAGLSPAGDATPAEEQPEEEPDNPETGGGEENERLDELQK